MDLSLSSTQASLSQGSSIRTIEGLHSSKETRIAITTSELDGMRLVGHHIARGANGVGSSSALCNGQVVHGLATRDILGLFSLESDLEASLRWTLHPGDHRSVVLIGHNL